ncbi:MAG: 1,4-alpha-glucan-branching protein [Chloroflexi bacterium]|nr:MAG: 1,4-alpha-glucan-branching protein [Chloroflexota bacterium]
MPEPLPAQKPGIRLDGVSPRRAYQTMGAHPASVGSVDGTRFTVWAPNARTVSVVGDWNTWRLPGHQLEFDHQSGIWTGFIPTIGHGATYKYAVVSRSDGVTTLKADPFAFASELRPSTASRIWGPSAEPWNDGPWVASRPYVQAPNRPISIYECHLGSWQRSPETPKLPLGYRELARQLAPYLKNLGYTHVELLPLTEYPLDESWGYQVTGYFAPTARYGTPDDFRFFVDYLHQNGIGVILDWVPGHFCKDQHGLGRFDGTALFEHGSRVRGEHPVWGTYQFDFGRPEVRTFLLASALYWLEVFHIDGLRVDAVASMVWLDHGRPHDHWEPNAWGRTDHPEAVDFLRRLNRLVHREVPGALMFAEEATAYEWVTRRDPRSGRSGTRTSTSDGPVDAITPAPVIPAEPAFRSSGGDSLGFDYKWNMGWMHDTLNYFAAPHGNRDGLAGNLTFPIWYAFDERFVLPLSHDEVVHLKRALLTKMPGSDPDRFAGLRTLFAYQYGHPGKKLLFMGSEFGQWGEWDEGRSLDWHLLEFAGTGGTQTPLHRGVQELVRTLNRIHQTYGAMHVLDSHPDGFRWLAAETASQGVIAFARFGATSDPPVVVVCNFSSETLALLAVPVPKGGRWEEILNTDDAAFGGSGTVNTEILPVRVRSRRVVTQPKTDGLIPRRKRRRSTEALITVAANSVSFIAPVSRKRLKP